MISNNIARFGIKDIGYCNRLNGIYYQSLWLFDRKYPSKMDAGSYAKRNTPSRPLRYIPFLLLASVPLPKNRISRSGIPESILTRSGVLQAKADAGLPISILSAACQLSIFWELPQKKERADLRRSDGKIQGRRRGESSQPLPSHTLSYHKKEN